MGLRFRKSIKIAPGLRLNLSKSGVSLTAGTRGFHKTIHTSGRVTTSVGLPGTGLSYVDTKYVGKNKKASARRTEAPKTPAEGRTASARLAARAEAEAAAAAAAPTPEPAPAFIPDQLTGEALRGIHRQADAPVDWIRLFRGGDPDPGVDPALEELLRSLAPTVLAGDTDAYLEVIDKAAPLDDLLAYGGEFLFGTDDPGFIEVEFTVNEEALADLRGQLNVLEYFELLRDYVCSVSLRTARDMFALLPVSAAVVHAVLRDDTVLSARFDKGTLESIDWARAEPAEAVARFEHRMDFQPGRGLAPVERIETGAAGE